MVLERPPVGSATACVACNQELVPREANVVGMHSIKGISEPSFIARKVSLNDELHCEDCIKHLSW